MCRFLVSDSYAQIQSLCLSRSTADHVCAGFEQVYKGGDKTLLSNLILDPVHSILKQSFDSRLRLVSIHYSVPSFYHIVVPPFSGAPPDYLTETLPSPPFNETNRAKLKLTIYDRTQGEA